MIMGRSLSFNFKIDGSDIKRIAVGNCQSQGARPYQEDSFGSTPIKSSYIKKHGFLAIVADGMGGLSGGAAVSSCTVNSMLGVTLDSNSAEDVRARLTYAMQSINSGIVESGSVGGSTAVAAAIVRKGVFWCSVGDSRLYLYRNGVLHQLTEDLDHMNLLLEDVIKGRMSYGKADKDPKRDALEQYIGYRKGMISPDANLKPLIPRKGDRLLLCSDGVYNAMPKEELACAVSLHAQEAADDILLRVAAKNYSNQDNFTSMVLEFI